MAARDQAEREHFFDDPEKVTKNDRQRRNEVNLLLKKGQVRTAADYFNAALIFQHGLSIADYKQAQALARTSVRRGGGEPARWLYAVASDRLLLARGLKQKYGSQLSIVGVVNPRTGRVRRTMKLLPYDKRTSDATRIRHGVPLLTDLLKMDRSAPPKQRRKILFQSERRTLD